MKNILITGIGSGIGAGLVQACLSRGDHVYALGRRIAPEISTTSHLYFRKQDLRELEGITKSVLALLKDAERLDLVILNAGILGKIGDLKDTPLFQIQELMTVNSWANKIIIDALFDLFIPIKQIVGISSGAAVSGSRGWNGYGLSKATFMMLIKLYAAEAPGTHFCSLAPGLVDTGMQEHLASLPKQIVDEYPVVARIRGQRGTPNMPQPLEAAGKLLDYMEKALSEPSGSYLDIRNM